MSKTITDMKPNFVRNYKGKKYKFVEQESKMSDYNFQDECCIGCAFENGKCHNELFEALGNCFEECRGDGKNGIFVEVEEG